MAARLTTYLVVAIVGVTLIAGLMVGAQRNDSDGPIDLIVHNAVVYTGDAPGTMAEAIAIRGNQVLRAGGNREIMRLQRPQTTMIDARGGAVLPGFNDADVQPIAGGLALGTIDLAGAADLAEIQARVRAWADANPDATWVIGHGWDPAIAPQGMSPRLWLDSAVPDRPAAMTSADGAIAWANTKALGTPGRNQKGRIAEASGIVTGAEFDRLVASEPRPTRAARVAALRTAATEAHRLGITSVQDIAASVDDLELYASAQRDADLALRVYGVLHLGTVSDAEIARLDAVANKYPDDPLFKSGAVSIALDGSVAAGTAAMLRPLPGNADVAQPLVPADTLNRIVRLLDERGWQVVIHAAGDRAVRLALDAFEHAARSNRAPARGRRQRLVAVEAIDEADLPRIQALGVLVSLNAPGIISSPALDAGGTRLVIGSQWPAGPLNPFVSIQAAVNASDRLPLKRAVDRMTSAAAYASFDEHRKGTLKAGMLADLVVLSDDIFSIPSSALSSVEVVSTIFDGHVVYQRDKKTIP